MASVSLLGLGSVCVGVIVLGCGFSVIIRDKGVFALVLWCVGVALVSQLGARERLSRFYSAYVLL